MSVCRSGPTAVFRNIAGLAALAEEVNQAPGSEDRFDLVVEVTPAADVRQWEAAGATWVLTSFEPQPPEDVVRKVIEAGP
jgi:hypothetical protein